MPAPGKAARSRQGRQASSEVIPHSETDLTGLDGFEVNILDRIGFTLKLAFIEIADVVIFRVEGILAFVTCAFVWWLFKIGYKLKA